MFSWGLSIDFSFLLVLPSWGGCHFFLIASANLRYAPLALCSYALTSSFWLWLNPPPQLPVTISLMQVSLSSPSLYSPPLLYSSTTASGRRLLLPSSSLWGSRSSGLGVVIRVFGGPPFPPSSSLHSSADYTLLQVASGFRIPSSVYGLFRMLLGSFHGCAFVFYFLLRCWR